MHVHCTTSKLYGFKPKRGVCKGRPKLCRIKSCTGHRRISMVTSLESAHMLFKDMLFKQASVPLTRNIWERFVSNQRNAKISLKTEKERKRKKVKLLLENTCAFQVPNGTGVWSLLNQVPDFLSPELLQPAEFQEKG